MPKIKKILFGLSVAVFIAGIGLSSEYDWAASIAWLIGVVYVLYFIFNTPSVKRSDLVSENDNDNNVLKKQSEEYIECKNCKEIYLSSSSHECKKGLESETLTETVSQKDEELSGVIKKIIAEGVASAFLGGLFGFFYMLMANPNGNGPDIEGVLIMALLGGIGGIIHAMG